jgi:hypothetical protein
MSDDVAPVNRPVLLPLEFGEELRAVPFAWRLAPQPTFRTVGDLTLDGET